MILTVVLLATVLPWPSSPRHRLPSFRSETLRLQEQDPPALPTDGNSSSARRLAVGETIELGPVVVSEDGGLRHIDNWQEMTTSEREATERIISKRNAARLKRLRGGYCSVVRTASDVEGTSLRVERAVTWSPRAGASHPARSGSGCSFAAI